MKLKIFFDFHDIFVDARKAWIDSFKEITNNDEIETDYNSKMSKNKMCKKYNIDYNEAEKKYREKLNCIDDNIDFAKKLSKFYKINIISMSKKERLLKDIKKIGLEGLFDEILSKEDINSKETYFLSISKDYDWIIYFNHDSNEIIQKDNIIYLSINLKGDLSKFKDLSFTEHAKNKLLYNELSKYYMYAIANDTSVETEFLVKLYQQNGLKENGKILDCCCGVGRHDYLLASKGFNVTGIDISESQINTAKSIHSHKNIKYNVMDARDINLIDKDYDMSICMWTTYNYFSQDKDFISFIKSNYEHQHKKSILILDAKNIPRLDKRRVYKRNSSIKNEMEMELIINKYIIGNIQNSQYFYFINENGNKKFLFDDEFVRFYNYNEISELVKDYYEVVNIYGDFDFSKYEENNSNRFVVVLRRL